MSLGFGNESATWESDLLHVPPGVWKHLAFTYDGAGTGAFFVDGSPAGSERKTDYGRISPGRHDLVLGDRVGSYYHGFPGRIDQVRLPGACCGSRRSNSHCFRPGACSNGWSRSSRCGSA
jgi:hypothetical protein